jgi:hypothetical protein
MAAVLAFSLGALSACSSKDKAETPPTTGGEPSVDPAGQPSDEGDLPNPLVKVDGPDAFKDQLAINLAPEDSGKNPQFTIIGDKTAQVEYDLEVDGETVHILARAEKTTELADISGIYDSFKTTEPGEAVGDVIPTVSYNEGELGYAFWYNNTAGLSGSVSITKKASAKEINKLAAFYINQENEGR